MSYSYGTDHSGFGPFVNDGVPSAGTSEVQTLTIGGTPTSGTFTIRFEGQVTSAITWSGTNATLVSNIDTALEALSNVGTNGVTTAVGTMTAGIGTITITFAGNRVAQPVGLMTIDNNSLIGTSPTASIARTTAGVEGALRGCPRGSLCIDRTNGKLYINTGTPPAMTWTVVGSQT